MDLTATTREVGEVTVVTLVGEIDVYTAPELRQHLTAIIAGGHERLVLDLTDVPFLDSTGLGVLVGRLKVLRQQGGDLDLVISSERVLRNFSITGLDKVFAIHPSAEAALAHHGRSDTD